MSRCWKERLLLKFFQFIFWHFEHHKEGASYSRELLKVNIAKTEKLIPKYNGKKLFIAI